MHGQLRDYASGMTSPGTGWLRYLRAGAVAISAVMLSATGHVLGGGHRPHPMSLALLTAIAMIPAYIVGGRRLSVVALGGLIGSAQLVVHFVLSSSTASGAHHQHIAPAGSGASAAGLEPHVMIVAHVSATLLISLVLSLGESLLWRLWLWVSTAWRGSLLVTTPVTGRHLRPVGGWLTVAGAADGIAANLAPRGPPAEVCLSAVHSA